MRVVLFASIALLGAMLCHDVALAQQRDPELPADLGLTERSGVSLVFLDVAVHDDDGQPVPGLTAEDFEVKFDHLSRAIYSVDDLCGCADADASDVGARPLVDALRREPTRYILYYDLSQLLPLGRARALEQSRRWLSEVRQPADEVMVVAHTTSHGLTTLTAFTVDQVVLDAALGRIENDAELADGRAFELRARRDDCTDQLAARERWEVDVLRSLRFDPGRCGAFYQEDYLHSRRSLRALLALFTRLAELPGRKTMLLFFEELVLSAGGEDAGGRSRDVPGHSYLLDEVASAATAARATVHAAFAGQIGAPAPPAIAGTVPYDHERLAVNFGANISDWTGGRYNYGPGDLPALLARAGRDCECIYRIAFEQRPRDAGKIYQATVVARGRPLRHPFRVQFLRESDRWLRKAESTLLDPLAASALDLRASVIPIQCRKGRWDLMLEVALDPDSLMRIPDGKHSKASWEVGALLASSDGDKAWEMLSISKLNREGGSGETVPTIVHRRRFRDLKARSYEVRAFARDRWTGELGGGLATLTLPQDRELAVVGPFALGSATASLIVELPLWGQASEQQTVSTGQASDEFVNLTDGGARAGQPLQFLTWLCGSEGRTGSILRRVLRKSETLVQVDGGQVSDADNCLRLEDLIVGAVLPAGDYRYEVSWTPPSAEPLVHHVDFRVQTAQPALREPSALMSEPSE